jgi:hypothetical protein
VIPARTLRALLNSPSVNSCARTYAIRATMPRDRTQILEGRSLYPSRTENWFSAVGFVYGFDEKRIDLEEGLVA